MTAYELLNELRDRQYRRVYTPEDEFISGERENDNDCEGKEQAGDIADLSDCNHQKDGE